MARPSGTDDDDLNRTPIDEEWARLQFTTVLYYLHETNPDNGMVRGAPFGPDDGTVAPWVVVASLPFAPEIVIPTVRNLARMDLGMEDKYGFKPSFNQSFVMNDSRTGWWVTPYHFGIDQGPVVLMTENYRTGLLWNIMRRCVPIVSGLRRAGFTGGWL